MVYVIVYYEEYYYEYDEEIKVMGFWFFFVMDCILFGVLFVMYVVFVNYIVGGFIGKEFFEVLGFVFEMFILLMSSFMSGLVVLSMYKGKIKFLIGWLIVILFLGMCFVGFEIYEF